MDNWASIKPPEEVRMRTYVLFLQMYYHISFEGELTLSEVKSLSTLMSPNISSTDIYSLP